MLRQLALVSELEGISHSQLTRVAAALQKQVTRDFGPLWDVKATVDAFVHLDDVPLGYWPIIVEQDIGEPGAAGIHLDKDNQPFALVEMSPTWSLTASHEALEILADPFGNRVIAGDSIDSDHPGRVEYLVEVCDPCEAWEYGYNVNGVRVSDFYTPSYFDPLESRGARYDFIGHITRPRQVLTDGYLSWHELETNHWWQLTRFGVDDFRDLGLLGAATEGLRSQIDRLTPVRHLQYGLQEGDERVIAASHLTGRIERATYSKAATWRSKIDEIKSGPRPHPVRSRGDQDAGRQRRRTERASPAAP